MREIIPVPDTVTVLEPIPGGGLRGTVRPLPEAGERDLVFRLEAAGFAPETLHAPDGRSPRGATALVGEIAAVGNRVNGWDALDRAVIIPESDSNDGGAVPQAADYFTVPAAWGRSGRMRKLPLEMRAETATLWPATAHASRLVKAAGVPDGGSLLVIGLDLVGQIVITLARHQRTPWILAADPSPTLRQRAEWGGAARTVALPGDSPHRAVRETLAGRGLDAAVVLGADRVWIEEALASLGPAGCLVAGSAEAASGVLGVDMQRLARDELTIRGIATVPVPALRDGFKILRQGLLDPDILVSRSVTWEAALELAPDPEFPAHGLLMVVEGPDPEDS